MSFNRNAMNRETRDPKKRKPDDGQRNLDSDDPQRRSKRPKQEGHGRGIYAVAARPSPVLRARETHDGCSHMDIQQSAMAVIHSVFNNLRRTSRLMPLQVVPRFLDMRLSLPGI